MRLKGQIFRVSKAIKRALPLFLLLFPTAVYCAETPLIRIDNPDHDFGTIYRGETAEHTFIIRNTGKARAHGLEMELNARLGNGTRSYVNYAHQRAEDESGVRLSNSPIHLLKLGLSRPAGRYLRLSSNWRLESGRRTLQKDDDGGIITTDPHLLGHLHLSTRAQRRSGTALGRLLERAPHVDLVLGTRWFHQIAELVERPRGGDHPIVRLELDHDPSAVRCRDDITQGATPLRAFVPIIRGCSNFCAYCIVPFVRGREVSREPKDVLQEVEDLVQRGTREVTLLGQNALAYGRDLSGGVSFPVLLREIAEVARVTEVTVRNRYKEIVKKLGIDSMTLT